MEFLSGDFSVSGKEKTMDVIYLENQCASVMRILRGDRLAKLVGKFQGGRRINPAF
jgi:hypothetical protein